LKVEQARSSRLGVLSRAAWGDFDGLGPQDGAGLDEDARKGWARGRLLEAIDEKVADLERHYESLDFETIDQDRAEATSRALFDPSKEACLARRYESAARREFFKAYQEFRRIEAEHAEREASAPPPTTVPAATAPAPLGSFRNKPSPTPTVPVEAPAERVPGALSPAPVVAFGQAGIVQGEDGQDVRAGCPIPERV
jgi:hypothetical protein